MKTVVLKVDFHDNKIKKKAMKTASGLLGVESVSVDMKDKKMTLSGDVDPVCVVSKLRKWCHTEIVSVEPEKDKEKVEPEKVLAPLMHYEAYPLYYQMTPPQYNQSYYVTSYDENPSSCVIC